MGVCVDPDDEGQPIWSRGRRGPHRYDTEPDIQGGSGFRHIQMWGKVCSCRSMYTCKYHGMERMLNKQTT